MGEIVLYSYCAQRRWFKRTGEQLILQPQEGENIEVKKEKRKKSIITNVYSNLFWRFVLTPHTQPRDKLLT